MNLLTVQHLACVPARLLELPTSRKDDTVNIEHWK
jgi:hypothetical protein